METKRDNQLIREYVDRRSEAAFSELVSRYAGLVYASAVRQVRDPHTAEDVAQTVFFTLARRAATVGPRVPLSGWLLKCTRYVVLCLQKSQSRRMKHERRAGEMTRSSQDQSGPESEDPWASLGPLLDESLGELSEKLRVAVVLRYFEGLSFEQTAARLGISDASARQRVSRGVETMRQFFSRRGVAVSETALTASVLVNAAPPPPLGLVGHLAAVVHLKPAAVHLAATKGALTFMAWTKSQIVVACAGGILLLGGATAVTLKAVRSSSREVVLDAGGATSTRGASLAGRVTDLQNKLNQAGPQATTLPADWRSQFQAAYGLTPDQVIRHIGPPYIPGRQGFYTEEQHKMGAKGAAPLYETESLTITWDAAGPHWAASTLDGGTLDGALWMCAQLRPWDLDKSVPRTLKLPGDFAFRQGATAAEVMRGLEPIVSEALRRPVHFEVRRARRESLVVGGSYRYAPLEGENNDGVINFEPGYDSKVPVQRGTLGEMLSDIKSRLEMRLFDETSSSKLQVRWRSENKWINPAKLLDNVARQTGLTLNREPRDTDVWFMVEGARAESQRSQQ